MQPIKTLFLLPDLIDDVTTFLCQSELDLFLLIWDQLLILITAAEGPARQALLILDQFKYRILILDQFEYRKLILNQIKCRILVLDQFKL